MDYEMSSGRPGKAIGRPFHADTPNYIEYGAFAVALYKLYVRRWC